MDFHVGKCYTQTKVRVFYIMRDPVTSLSRGNKRICQECHTKFFDLRKSPILCPKCGTEFATSASFKTKGPGAKKATVKEEEHDLTDVELVGDDISDDLMEDASELDDGSDVVTSKGNGDSDSDDEDV